MRPKWLRLMPVALCAIAFFIATIDDSARAETYPSRAVDVIVAFAPGGSTDVVARALTQKLGEHFVKPFVILNKPGASGALGIRAAAAAKPDGYTLYVGYTSEVTILPEISKDLGYSVLDDFEPIAITGLMPNVLIVSKNVKANNLAEFIAEMRANPDHFTYGGGAGSPPQIMGAWMNKIRGLKVRHIPYRGGAQSVTDVIGGHLDMFYGGVAAAKAAIESGNVKALAVTGDTRSAALPDVPTFKEAGVPEFDLESWTVMLAPKGTPQPIIDVIRKETLAILDDPPTREALAKQGVERSPNQDVRAFLLDEKRKFGRAVRELNITMGD